MWTYNNTINSDELYHYGVLGMKWGRRMARGRGGLGMYAGKKRQLAGDKRDLDTLNKGGHLSVGATKKRQAAYDKRDKAKLEKRIAKTEKKIAKKQKTLTNKKVLSGKAKAKIILGSGLGLASAIYSGKAAGNGKKFVIGLLASYGSGRIIRSGLEEPRRNTSKK